MTFVISFESCRVYLATTAEELPLSETRELAKSFAAIQVPIYSVLFNRVRSIEKSSSDQQAKLSSDWQREYTFEKEAAEDEKENIREFCSSLDSSVVKLSVPELYVASPKDMIPQISSLMKGIL